MGSKHKHPHAHPSSPASERLVAFALAAVVVAIFLAGAATLLSLRADAKAQAAADVAAVDGGEALDRRVERLVKDVPRLERERKADVGRIDRLERHVRQLDGWANKTFAWEQHADVAIQRIENPYCRQPR